MRVGIIGGGVAGLAAAYDLTAQGHYAEVFEVAPFLGGQASTFQVGRGQLERGYHHLFVSDTAITELIHELGLGHKLTWLESKVGLYHQGRIWDFSTPMDLLRFKLLSLWQRLRVGLWTLRLQRIADYSRFEDITARDWLSRHMGAEAYRVLFEPLLRGKFGDHYDQVSMTWLWGKVRLRVASRGKAMTKERLGYPMGSFGEVIDALAARIRQQGGDVHTSARVNRILTIDSSTAPGVNRQDETGEYSIGTVQSRRASGLEVVLRQAQDDRGGAPGGLGGVPGARDVAPGDQDPVTESREYDAVIATTPSYVFTRLVPPMPEDYQKMLTGVNYLSAVLLVLELDRPLTAKYWLNIADQDMPFVAIIEHTNMIDKSLYGGRHIVYISNYPDRQSELYRMEPEALLERFIPHLRKLNPDFERSWVHAYHHHRVDGAQPIIGKNYSQRIPPHHTPIRGLYLANTTQIFPEDRGTNYSIRMGRQVAHMVMDDLAWPAPPAPSC